MNQYTDFSTIPQQVRDVVANKVKLLDEYILIQTGQYEYTALIHDLVTDDVIQLCFTRSSNYSTYTVDQSAGIWDFTVSNEYYCYSNVGLGAALDLPVYDGIQAHCSAVLVVALMFLIVFRSALFPFRKKK